MSRRYTGLLFLVIAFPALGQPAPPPTGAVAPPPPPPSSGGLTVRDASVGYIDSAALADQIRLRSDFGYDFRTPNRAEFFYARGNPFGPGLPRPERAIDFQDYTLYLEKTLAGDLSVFAEGGLRAVNPDINDNAMGFADGNLGFKYAIVNDECSLCTFQLRAYLPTGAASRGLGNRHVSLEPAVLGFSRLTENLGVASEVRYWQPIGGTDFAGGVLRYGLGLRYDVIDSEEWRLAPMVEVIGWTVLNGQEARLMPNGTQAIFESSDTTVVNVKLGARVDFGERIGIYAGYGRTVTGERWYRDVFRVEVRWLY